MRFDVVQRFIADPAGEGGVTGYDDNVLIIAPQIATHGHAQSGRQGGAGMARAVAVVLALRPRRKPFRP